MYTIGSIADLISGTNTPKKKSIVLKEVKYETKNVKDISIKKKKEFQKEKIVKKEVKEPVKSNKKLNNAERRINLKRKLNTQTKDTTKRLKLENTEETISNKKKLKEKTIFVGNVPVETQKREMIKFFSKYGEVENLRFRNIPVSNLKLSKKVALIKKSFHPKRKTMNCYVVFKSSKDAVNAKNANGAEFKENHLRVDYLNDECEYDKNKAIFIGNVPFNAEEDDVRNLFSMCGNITSVRLVRDKKTEMGKGFGYVNFDSSDAVELALQMDEVKIGQKELRVSRIKEETQDKKTPDGKKIREKFAIHINNLPRNVKETEIRELFKKCGRILSVRIAKGADKTSFCYVNFADKKAVDKATTLADPKIGKVSIKINECKPKSDKPDEQHDDNLAVYLSKIPSGTTQEDIRKIFEDCGKISTIRLIIKKFRKFGVCFVNFNSSDAVEKALEKKNVTIKDIEINISKKISKNKKEDHVDKKIEQEESESENEDTLEDLNSKEEKNWESDSSDDSEEED